MNIIMPMAGLGKRLSNLDYDKPKPLIEILGKMVVEWSIETIGLNGNFIFCCRDEHIKKFKLDQKLKDIVPNCTIVPINYNTEGTAQTILEARKFIDNDEELFISDSDHYMVWNSDSFEKEIRNQNFDACALVFPDEQDSNRLSYVKVNENGFLAEATEKIPISKIAVAGMHYYKKGSDFVKYAKIMIDKNIRFNNEFYVTPVYNELILDGKKVTTFPVIKKWALGSPDEIKKFVEDKPFNQFR